MLMAQLQMTQLSLPPDMIHLGIGQPSPSLLPLDIMREAAIERLSQSDPSLLAYGAEQGDGYFRTTLAQLLSDQYGEAVDPGHLFITAGASQSLDLICTIFTQAGDTIFVEEPSYFLALRIFRDHRLKIVGIAMDEEGLDLNALEENLAVERPIFLYTIPTYHNPASVTLTHSRREQLVRLSRKYGFIIIADEVYQLLNYLEQAPRPLACWAEQGSVLSMGSFSKILAPGLRLGWIHGTRKLLDKLIGCGLLDSGGGLNPFTSGIVRSTIEMGLLSSNIEHLKSVYVERLRVLQSAIKQELAEAVTFHQPKGGFFMWLKLPHGIIAEELLHEARKNNVAFLPGNQFSCSGEMKNYMRLSFAFYEAEELKTGAQRLGSVVKQWKQVGPYG
jgi:2-aminoadipate transaminase